MDVWERLRTGLAELAPHAGAAPGGRLGAALVLLRDPGDGDLELVFTRRRDDLRSHPGQISFPGGRVDPGETIEQAALREAAEEVALQRTSAELLGRLPPFYIPPSRFWLHAVLARWVAPHPLTPAEAEVAQVLSARVSALRDAEAWRSVELSHGGHTWAWQLDDRHLLWGATAVVTAVVLGLLDPEWSGGVEPGGLGPDRAVRPWELAPRARPVPRRIPHAPQTCLDEVAPLPSGALRGLPSQREAAALGAGLADAALALVPGAARPLVLVGPGGTGVAAAAAARHLAQRGLAPIVVSSRAPRSLPAPSVALLQGLGAQRFAGSLPGADVVVDGLLGAGIEGKMRGAPLDVAHALRHLVVPVVSADLPSGVHPERGLVGDAVTADVTVGVAGPRPGLLRPGLEPFGGDLYLAGPDGLTRLVRAGPAAGWRE
jgi:NAD(P)H-hydrate repair Nnr-like enzyme with NAD(P)H-hydrate epimerase domain/8-oxo-dGTP pyrophosphatase MutT (NUDIX family)